MMYYFAYGSNMDEERLKDRVGVYTIVGKGVLEEYKLVFNKPASGKPGKGFANIVLNKKNRVEGIVYELSESAIAKLDLYEGVPNDYIRQKRKVFVDNSLLECETYFATKTQEGLRPTKDYLEHILAGKKFLSVQYLNFLKQIQTK